MQMWVVFETPQVIPMCRQAWKLLYKHPIYYLFYTQHLQADRIWPWGLYCQFNLSVVILIVL